MRTGNKRVVGVVKQDFHQIYSPYKYNPVSLCLCLSTSSGSWLLFVGICKQSFANEFVLDRIKVLISTKRHPLRNSRSAEPSGSEV